MGDHSAENGPLKQIALDAGAYVWRNRRKILAGALVALPLVSRYFPGFPLLSPCSSCPTYAGRDHGGHCTHWPGT
jgi:hypothetical protein